MPYGTMSNEWVATKGPNAGRLKFRWLDGWGWKSYSRDIAGEGNWRFVRNLTDLDVATYLASITDSFQPVEETQ